MAFPVILVDSTSGSDSAASGAGPATALSGTSNASTSGTGLVVTLPASTDLSGVAVDGSHVIFLNDSTAGARNFGKITAQSGSGGATPTVTVADAFGLSLTSKSWAIGGRRATINSATSAKLTNNNNTAGDAMPGWVIEMQSGHVETLANYFQFYRAGDLTNGPIVLRGVAGAATRPVITLAGGFFFYRTQSYVQVRSFDAKDTSGHSVQVFQINSQNVWIDDIRAADATSYPLNLATSLAPGCKLTRCKAKTAGACVTVVGGGCTIALNDLTSTGSKGSTPPGATRPGS